MPFNLGNLKDLKTQMEQRTTLSSLLNKGYLDRPVYLKSLNALVQELIAFLKKNKEITEYSEELFDAHVDTIKVLFREEIQFNLRCGLVLTERL